MRVPILTDFDWQKSVEAILNDPPATPTKGDRYIVGDTPTGDWIGNANRIVWYNGTSWDFDTEIPSEGWFVFVKTVVGQTTGFFYRYEDGAWNIFTSAPIPETQTIDDTDSPFDASTTDIVIVDTTTDNVTITLPDLTTIVGTENQREKIIYKDDYSPNYIRIEAFTGQTINDQDTVILTGLQKAIALKPTTNGWVIEVADEDNLEQVLLLDGANPDTPPTGFANVYVDGGLKSKDDTGVVTTYVDRTKEETIENKTIENTDFGLISPGLVRGG
ncbi:MAG: DUF2793 domain-containing protein, partial [Candidatus Paceibacterota bacterium]